MSQELSYQRVASVSEAVNNYQRELGPIIAQIMSSAPAAVTAGVKKCSGDKRVKSRVLLAPTELNVIQTDFDQHLKEAKTQDCGKVEQMKVAAIATIAKSQDNLLLSEPDVVVDKIQRIIEAGTVRGVKQEIKAAFQEIKTQHTKSFVDNVSNAVQESAASIGFKTISVQEPHIGMVRIVAVNQTGQNLIAEIESNEKVDIHSELVGYADGSCEKVMKAFDDEMSARGITTERKEQKPTYGIPQLPFAKRLLKNKAIKRRTFKDESPVQNETSVNQITIKQ